MFTDKLTLAIAEAAKKCMDEELVGNQHKIDANKNGKVDAHDFKLIRKQKGVSEELKGNQHKIDANKNGKVDAHDFKLLRKEEQMSNPGLETLASKLRAARTGKPSNPALEKLAHEKAKAKYLNKEETVNEEGLKDACWKGYEAIGTKKKNGKEVPNCVPVKEDSYSAQNVYDKAHTEHMKNNPKTSESEAHKHALSVMKKRYPNHTASSGEGQVYKLNEEEGQNGYVAFSHDGRKADIHANSSYEAHRKAIKHFDAPKAKHHMVVVKLAQKGGKDVVHTATESVQEAAIDDLRDRQAAKREANPYGSTAKKEDPAKRVVQGNQYGGAKQKDEKEVDEAVESTNQHYVMAHNRARGVSSIVKKDGEHHLHPSKEAASEHAGKLNAKSSSPHVYYTYGGNINEDTEDLNEISKYKLTNYINKAKDQEHIKDRSSGIRLALSKKRGDLGYGFKAPRVMSTEEVESLDESKAHIEQHLADRDINSKVMGKTVKVHSSDVASATKHVKMAGYKDHKVVGGLNEEKMSDEDMEQREKIVNGMKKNLQGFKARYGDRAKDVMYATATKQAMKEGAVPSTEKTVKVKHATSGKEIVVTTKSADKYKSLGYHPVKEEAEHIVEREDSPTKGTRKIASYGDHAHTAEVRYNPEYQEYQVHHYKAGKHQGEGPVSYHYEDKADAHGTAKRSVGIKEEVEQMKEDFEQIDELSKKTLGSYAKKADADRIDSLNRYNTQDKDAQGNKIRDKYRSPARKAIDNLLFKRIDKRIAGYNQANTKLAKEEVEHIYEAEMTQAQLMKKIKNGTHEVMSDIKPGKHVEVRHTTTGKRSMVMVREDVEVLDEASVKLFMGMYQVWHKGKKVASYNSKTDAQDHANSLKEEVTNDDFKTELEDNKAKAAGTKKQPDIAKASVQAVKQESFSSKLTSLKEGVRSYLKGRNNG